MQRRRQASRYQHQDRPSVQIRAVGSSRKAQANDATAQLPGRHQGRRHRRRWCERHQPDDRGRPPWGRVHRHQHRCAGPADERRRRQARRRPRDDPRPRRRGEPGRRPQGRRGSPRGDRGGAQGCRHGLRHRRGRRWNGNRRRPRRRLDRPQARRADHRRRHPAVRLRGSAPRRPGRERHQGTAQRVRHADRHPQRPAAAARRHAASR